MSDRIDKIISLVRPGHTLFDMCCDHGLIGFGALNKAKEVVFVDQSAKALKTVEDHYQTLNQEDKNKIRILTAPAELIDISAYESSDFVIAGVGVTTIASIIAALFPHELSHHRLILSPQQDSLPLRWYLKDRGFGLIQELVVKERIRFREIMVVEAKGPEVTEMFLPEHDEVSRNYRSWLKHYRENVPPRKFK